MIKKIILRAVVFIAVATCSALVVDKVNNININKVSREIEQSTLPSVYCYVDNKIVNPMRGYTQVMATSLMRDSVVPLNSSHGVEVLVDEKTSSANTYSYELRSINGDNLIEKGEIDNTEITTDGYKKLNINFRMDMDKNQEYTLVVILTPHDFDIKKMADIEDESDIKKIRYYTRVANLEENNMAKMIDYAYDFHYTTFEKTFSDEDGNMVYEEIHPKAEAADGDLSHVSLDSNYRMISWGDMDIIALTSLIPTIVELDDEFALVKFSYIAQNYETGNEHYYNISEYYSMKYDKLSGKVKLLTFDRYQSSFFDEGYINKFDNCIGLGITAESDIEYMTSDENNMIAFVKEGELWLYDYMKANLTSVFSLVQRNYTTASASDRNFDINIDGMDDDGNIFFSVYGYMNRGKHEGENGISLYYYTIDDSKIEEILFIRTDEPYNIMKQEVGKFSHYDKEDGIYTFLLNGKIYYMNLSDKEIKELTPQLPPNKYLVSTDGNIIAYPNSNQENEVTEIIAYNYDTKESLTQTSGGNSKLQALGFMENDLIYGEAEEGDISISTDGKVTMPLKTLRIIRPDGALIKTYEKPNTYVMNSVVNSDKIYLKRSTKSTNFFLETEPDVISYKKTFDENQMSVKFTYDDSEMKEAKLVLPNKMYLSETSNPIMTKQKPNSKYKEMELNSHVATDRYYVFSNQGYKAEYKTAGQAIEDVVNIGDGLVVDANGKNIYRNQDAVTYNTVASSIKETKCEDPNGTLMTCAFMCINYMDKRVTYDEVLACGDYMTAFKELTTGVGLNISGIDLPTALYFLDRDIPFAAKIGEDGRYVLVISYNRTHIRYYDPVEDDEIKVKRSEFQEALSRYGNTMYTFAR